MFVSVDHVDCTSFAVIDVGRAATNNGVGRVATNFYSSFLTHFDYIRHPISDCNVSNKLKFTNSGPPVTQFPIGIRMDPKQWLGAPLRR